MRRFWPMTAQFILLMPHKAEIPVSSPALENPMVSAHTASRENSRNESNNTHASSNPAVSNTDESVRLSLLT